VPKRIMIAGQYRDVYWRLETISYYYAGSLSTAEAYYAGDTDLGSFTISPAPTVEVSLDISTIGTPPDRPVDTYVFGAWYNETFFKISVETNATIFGFSLGRFIVDGGEGVFQLRLYSPYGLSSIVRVTIPKDIMSTSISVDDDGTPIPFNIVGENQTHFTVEFRVSGEALINIRSAEVIPEFSSIYLLLLIAVPTGSGMSLSIAVITETFHPFKGGSAKRYLEVFRRLVRLGSTPRGPLWRSMRGSGSLGVTWPSPSI